MITQNQTDDLGIIRHYLDSRSLAVEEGLRNACSSGDLSKASSHLHEMMEVGRARRATDDMIRQQEEEVSAPVYMLSTFFILQALKDLTVETTEDLRFATGIAVAPKQYVVTSLCQFKLKQKSLVSAVADHESMTRMLIGLYEFEHKLLMTTHSHPVPGMDISCDTTAPSSTDLDFHMRLEAGSYPVIGMIVNRHGFVRFFSHQRRFVVQLFGKGMEVINESKCLFKLNSIGSF